MPRGSKPGERRGGRKKGSRNLVTHDVRALAQPYTAEAIETLTVIMHAPTSSGQVRVAAAVALLDRAWGRPAQALTGADGGAIAVQTIVEHHHESS